MLGFLPPGGDSSCSDAAATTPPSTAQVREGEAKASITPRRAWIATIADHPTRTPMSDSPVVQLAIDQLAAYNAADLDAFCRCYHPEVVALDAEGAVTIQGIEAFRERYGTEEVARP